jgi:hypothetical protein
VTIASLLLAATLSQPVTEAAPAAPTPAPDAAPAATAPAMKPPTPYGFVQVQYSATDKPAPAANTSTFELRRARLGLRGELTPEIAYNILWDGADSSLKDAWGGLKLPLGVELRGGQTKTPFGYEQLEADTRLLWLYNSAVVAALARGKDSRDLGLFAGWKGQALGTVGAELAAALVNGAGPNVKDDLTEKNVWTRGGLVLPAAAGTLRAGVSYGYGRQVQSLGADGRFGVQGAVLDDTCFYFHTTGADLTFDSAWLFLAAEAIQSSRHVQRYTAPAAVATSDVHAWGWYAGAYGKTSWGGGPILRAEAYDGDDASTATGDRVERYTVGAYGDLVAVKARLVLNYELDESDPAVRTGDRFIALAQVLF